MFLNCRQNIFSVWTITTSPEISLNLLQLVTGHHDLVVYLVEIPRLRDVVHHVVARQPALHLQTTTTTRIIFLTSQNGNPIKMCVR